MPKAKLKTEDYEDWLGSAQMWKHEGLAKYIYEQTDIKLDPVEVALVIALRSEWRTSEGYFSLLEDRRSKVESKRNEVQKIRSRKTAEQDGEVEPEPKKVKPKNVKKSKVKQQEQQESHGRKSKIKKSKKVKRSTVAEETIFDD